MIDVAEVRKRLIHTIERVKHDAVMRRREIDEATAAYDRFLELVATPVFRHFSQALRSAGYNFQLFTPAGSVRLASERGADDYIELALDQTRHPITVIGRTSFRRGSRLVENERPVREGRAIDTLTDEHVLEYLLDAIEPFVER
jgi:hypothetical protein